MNCDGQSHRTDARLNVVETSLQGILADEGGKAVLEKHLGSILKHPQIGLAMQLSLQQIAQFVPDVLTTEKLRAINEDLATVSN